MIMSNRCATLLLMLSVAVFCSSPSYAQTGEDVAKALLSEMAKDSRQIRVADYSYSTSRTMDKVLGIKSGLDFEVCDSANALKVFTWNADDAIRVASILRYSRFPVPVHVWFCGYHTDGHPAYGERKPLLLCYCYIEGRFITHNFETEARLDQDPLLTIYGLLPPEFVQLNDRPNKNSGLNAVAYHEVSECLASLFAFASPRVCATATMGTPLLYLQDQIEGGRKK